MSLRSGVLLAALLLFALSSKAASDAPVMKIDKKEDGLVAELYAKPCTDQRIIQVFAVAMPYYADKLQEMDSAFLLNSGKWQKYAGCWVEVEKDKNDGGAEGIIIFLEDGDYYLLKKEYVKGTGV